MEIKQTGNSKEQERQARQNKQAASGKNENDGFIDKRLDGPNRPSE